MGMIRGKGQRRATRLGALLALAAAAALVLVAVHVHTGPQTSRCPVCHVARQGVEPPQIVASGVPQEHAPLKLLPLTPEAFPALGHPLTHASRAPPTLSD
jgi:hypothetical protein